MAETIRNEAINQIAVGGHVRATKPAAANSPSASWIRNRETKRRNQTVTLKASLKIDEHSLIRREQTSRFLRREKTDIALRLTDFMDSDLDYRSDRERGRGGSVEICCVFALMLDIHKRLEETDRRSGYSQEVTLNILLLFYYFFFFLIISPPTAATFIGMNRRERLY